MDLKYTIDTEEGPYDLYLTTTPTDIDYLHRLALTFLLDNGMFPFRLLSDDETCNFHQPPESIQ